MADGWTVRFVWEFEAEFKQLDEAVQAELGAHARVVGLLGPELGRPHVGTLRDSAYSNMKEIRFNTESGAWRVAFAFDPKVRAVLLVAGNKVGLRGKQEEKFYANLIRTADARYGAYLERLEEEEARKKAGSQMPNRRTKGKAKRRSGTP